MLVERFYVFSFLLSFSKFILFAPFPEFFSLFFIEEPIFENFDRITVYYIGTFEGQENPTFSSTSSLMQENQIELVPFASVGWTWIYVLCQFKKNDLSVLENSNDDDSKWSTKIYASAYYCKSNLYSVWRKFCWIQVRLFKKPFKSQYFWRIGNIQ